MGDHTGFLENWQDALVFWSFVAVTIFVAWRIMATPPKQ
jgi:cyanate permease